MSLVRIVVLVFGAVYVLVGVLGFLGEPVVTDASHGDMESARGDLFGLVAPDTFGLMPIGGRDILLHLGTAAILLGVTFLNPEPDAGAPA